MNANRIRNWLLALATLTLAGASALVPAEPYLAVRSGEPCSSCHVNPTGGGLRTAFGTAYGIGSLPAGPAEGAAAWTGRLGDRVGLGGDLRANLNATSVRNRDRSYAFGRDEALVYVEFAVLPERLSLYIDQQVGPGTAVNREAYALLKSPGKSWHLKAGRLFLPYGLRLEDDSAYVRQMTGISMANADDGIEIGWQRGPGAVQLAITNGTNGGAETDKGKQWSLHGTHVSTNWRVGASVNFNDGEADRDRLMGNLYLGLKTGPIAWLAEFDQIFDDAVIPQLEQRIGLIEANYGIAPGHNIKVTYEYFDPDTSVDEDQRNRTSLVLEYTPLPFTQLRLGYRHSDGIPQNDLQHVKEAFLQLHLYF